MRLPGPARSSTPRPPTAATKAITATAAPNRRIREVYSGYARGRGRAHEPVRRGPARLRLPRRAVGRARVPRDDGRLRRRAAGDAGAGVAAAGPVLLPARVRRLPRVRVPPHSGRVVRAQPEPAAGSPAGPEDAPGGGAPPRGWTAAGPVRAMARHARGAPRMGAGRPRRPRLLDAVRLPPPRRARAEPSRRRPAGGREPVRRHRARLERGLFLLRSRPRPPLAGGGQRDAVRRAGAAAWHPPRVPRLPGAGVRVDALQGVLPPPRAARGTARRGRPPGMGRGALISSLSSPVKSL